MEKLFKPIIVGGYLRDKDGEYKLLEYASEIAKDGKEHEIVILSQYPCCPSCKGVAEQFAQMFPNVKLTLVSTKESRMKKSEKGEGAHINAWKRK
ncbi:MAG: deaminase domain-containing protein [Bacillota bacterium]|nr:deaminase domain-containing protein [Bacillota bacterium]